jgi:hypothetical protein
MATSNTMSEIKFSLQALINSINTRSAKGVLLIVVDDKNVQGLYTYKQLKKVTDDWETANKTYITTAFSDYGVNEVMVVSAHVGDTTGTMAGKDNISNSLSTALSLLNKVYVNGYMVVPQITTNSDKKIVADFVKEQRVDDYPLKCVLFNYSTADNEGIINFTGSNLTNEVTISSTVGNATVDGSAVSATTIESVSSNDYTVDVASYLCTLGANESITNHTAKNVVGCDVKADEDACVANGELFLYNNGSNIVFSRGVNSKQTFASNESEALSKIRVIDVIDMVKSDLRLIFNSTYLGKVGNSYTNRKSLCVTLNNYLSGISSQGYLSNDDTSYVELDVNATKTYLESLGTDTDGMTDAQILRAKIDTHVFADAVLYIMDIIEDINFVLQYET